MPIDSGATKGGMGGVERSVEYGRDAQRVTERMARGERTGDGRNSVTMRDESDGGVGPTPTRLEHCNRRKSSCHREISRTPHG